MTQIYNPLLKFGFQKLAAPGNDVFPTGSRLGWGWQDFTAGEIAGTSATLAANSNGTGIVFDPTKVIGSSAVIVTVANNFVVPYTGSIKLFSSKVTATNAGDVVTLTGIPHTSWGSLRIFYAYTYEVFPVGYSFAPKFIGAKIINEMDALFVTEEEFTSAMSDIQTILESI